MTMQWALAERQTVTLKSHHGKYLSAQQEGTAVAIVDAASVSHTRAPHF